MWEDISNAPFDQDLELAVIDRDGPHALVFPCRRVLGGWLDAETGRRIQVRPTHWRPSDVGRSLPLWIIPQRCQLGLLFGQQAREGLSLGLVSLGGKLRAEVLNVCFGDEFIHEERALNARMLRRHDDSIKEAGLFLDDRFHESCHFGGFIPAVWIPI